MTGVTPASAVDHPASPPKGGARKSRKQSFITSGAASSDLHARLGAADAHSNPSPEPTAAEQNAALVAAMRKLMEESRAQTRAVEAQTRAIRELLALQRAAGGGGGAAAAGTPGPPGPQGPPGEKGEKLIRWLAKRSGEEVHKRCMATLARRKLRERDSLAQPDDSLAQSDEEQGDVA